MDKYSKRGRKALIQDNFIDGLATTTSYEKFMLCYYITALIKTVEIGADFCKFYWCLDKILKINNKELSTFIDNPSWKLDDEEKFKQKLKEVLIKKSEKLKCNNSKIKNMIMLVSDVYGLSKLEYEYLQYYILKTICPSISCINSLLDNSFSEFENLGVYIFNLKRWTINQIRKRMIKKGVFIKQGLNDEKISVNIKILEIFENPNIKTIRQVKNILLGENQKSELSWKDFEHLEKERDITLNILTSAIENKTKGINILLYGAVGTGKTQFAKLISNKAKCDIYSVSAEFMDKEATRKDRLFDLSSKQTILAKSSNSCLLFDEAEDVMNRGFTEFGSASKAYLNTLIEETPIPIFWTTNNIYNVDPAFLRRMTYTIEFEKLTDDIRLNIWKKVVRKNKLKVDMHKLIELNKNYDIPPSLISNAVMTTKLINGSQDDFEIFVENVAKVVTKKKNVKKKKEFEMNEYNDDLVNTDLDIKDLTLKIKSCGKLNFSLCLYGEPGTGKSLYARYLANELGLDVILKRASDLMSKYVGETEQNIANAFAEAKSKKAILIFDEADSFLQNRNNAVRNWEVSQVDEMLTWMESNEYPFVCTTNLLDYIDEASLRRFTFKIKFDYMTKDQVNNAFEHFFRIKNANVNIKGLTAGDFATVKKKADFLCVNEFSELCKMLEDEVKIKKAKILKNNIGFDTH